MGVAALGKSIDLDGFLDHFIPLEIRVRPDSHRRARMFMLSHVFGPFLGNVIPLYLWAVGYALDYRFWIFAASITAFWVYPLVLKWTRAYEVVAFASVQNLLFCILWACYSYGGIYSPFLPWLLITPILAFFYFPSTGIIRDAVLALMLVNVSIFGLLVLFQYPFPEVHLETFQVIGIISTISASVYVAMMSLYFARLLNEQQRFEREVGEFIATSENLQAITAAAEQASQAKADFVASMSHELRTPLNAVIGYSQLLLDDALDEGDEDVARDVEHIHGAGTHLLKLVNDILDFSKIEAGKYERNLTVDSVQQRVAEVARLMREPLEQRGYTLDLLAGDADAFARTDWTVLTKGVIHLLQGAANAPGGGAFTLLATTNEGGEIRLVIEDPKGALDGRGADALFDIFTDDKDATPTKYGGAGIDLALGQRFVRLLGGEIEVANDPRGGRSFTIIIPADAAQTTDLALAS
jgi:signal transduction histidine kinase